MPISTHISCAYSGLLSRRSKVRVLLDVIDFFVSQKVTDLGSRFLLEIGRFWPPVIYLQSIYFTIHLFIARRREPFSLDRRPGSPFWYYKLGAWKSYKTTGKKLRSDAMKVAMEALETAEADPSGRHCASMPQPFFVWDRCPHVRRLLSEGKSSTRDQTRRYSGLPRTAHRKDELHPDGAEGGKCGEYHPQRGVLPERSEPRPYVGHRRCQIPCSRNRQILRRRCYPFSWSLVSRPLCPTTT
jgi:hypothetical protein